MLDLSRQFHDRIIRKTYMAIVNGIPDCLDGDGIEDRTVCRVISAREARDIGVDVDDNEDPIGEGTEKHDPCIWNLIDSPLEEKNAVTVWRSVHHARSLQTIKDDGYLTLVELKPKTGYELLRPLVVDSRECLFSFTMVHSLYLILSFLVLPRLFFRTL